MPTPDLGAPPPALPPLPTPAIGGNPAIGEPPTPQPSPQSGDTGFNPIGAALNAASQSGADMDQFGQAFNQHLNSGASYIQASLNAASQAGADVAQFGSTLGGMLPPPAPAPTPQGQDPGLGAPINTPSQSNQAAAAWRGGAAPVEAQRQFEQEAGLSSGDAYTACGPVAAAAFAQTYGRNPTPQEAVALARSVGWDPSTGMAGPQSEVSLLNKMGIDAHVTGVNWGDVAASAQSGNPVILNTPNHYLYVDGYDAQSGAYHVGQSGASLRGGSEWMTPDQIAQVPGTHGAANAAIYVNHPLGDGNPVTDVLGQGGGNLPSIDSSSPQAFGKSVAPYAQYAAQQLGIDPTWVAAMMGSESNYGKAPGNELFGIKATAGTKSQSLSTHEGEYGGTTMNQSFAAYDSPLESVDAFVNLIKNHYPGAVGAQDLGTFVHGLKSGGYFTAAEDEYKGILQSIGNNIGGAVQQGLQGGQNVIQGATQGVQQGAQNLLQQGQQGLQSLLDPLSQQMLNAGQGAQDLLGQGQSALAQLDPLSQQLLNQGSSIGQGAQDLLGTGAQTAQTALSQLDPISQQLLNQGQSTLDPLSQLLSGIKGPSAGDTANLGPLQVGPFPEGDSVIPIKLGGVDITQPYNSEEATRALLGSDANPTLSSTVNQLLNPVNAFFGPLGYLAGGTAGAGSGLAGQAAQAMGGDQTAQTVASLVGGLGGGLAGPAALERLGPQVLDLLADPAVQAALRYRQVGSTDVNAALGGLPAALGIGGEQQLPEHAGNAARAVYNAAVESNIAPATGAQQIQRAFDMLGQYPEEISTPIRQFAVSSGADPSRVASTIMRWVQENPLDSVPNPFTGPSIAARETGQQAVADIADEVLGRGRGIGGSAGYLPQGTMPGQLGLLPGTDYQPVISQGSGLLDELLTNLAPGSRTYQQPFNQAAQTGESSLMDIVNNLGAGGRTYQTPFNQAAQTGESSLMDLVSNLTAGDRTYTPGIPQSTSGGNIDDFLHALYQDYSPASTATPATTGVLGAPGAAVSKLGSFIASAASPTENLPAATKAALEDFANTVGRQSNAAGVIARSQAAAENLTPEVEQRLRQGLVSKATTDLMETLRDQKLAAPIGSDPAAPGFTAPKGQGWTLASQVPGSELSRWMVHPSVAGPINAVVGRSAIANNPLGRAILNAGGVGKGTIFSLSNFHAYTEGLNALFTSPQTAKNMARAFASDNFAQGIRGSMAQTFNKAAKAGVTGLFSGAAPDVEGEGVASVGLRRAIAGTVGGVGGGASGYAEAKIAGKSDEEARSQAARFGIAGAALAGFPMVAGGRGTVAEELSKALWERAVPIAKTTAWQSLTNGGMDASTAAKVVNERFGGLNYAAMGRSPTLQDAARIAIMAPDWGESTIRQAGRLLGGPATGEARGFLGRAIGGTLAVTELLNYAMSGHSTMDNQPGHQFEVETRDPAGGFTHVGLIPGNFLSYLNLGDKLATDTGAKRGSDLMNFATGRAAAVPAALAEAGQAFSSRNSLTQPYGFSKAGPASILSNLSPIAIAQVAQGINSGGMSPEAAAIMAILGLNPRYSNPTTVPGTTGVTRIPTPGGTSTTGRPAPVERTPTTTTTSGSGAGRPAPVRRG